MKDEKVKKYNHAIPEELLLSIRQSGQPKEYMGPMVKKGKPVISVNRIKF